MLPLANLINGLLFWTDLLVQGYGNLSFAHGHSKNELDTQKTTVYLPMLKGVEGNRAVVKREVLLNEHLRSLHLALYYFSETEILNISEVNLRFHWKIKCGRFNYAYSVPVKRIEKTLEADIDQRDFGPSRFQIYNNSDGHNTILHFSISITVSADIIGSHAFSLIDRKGNTVLGSAKVLLKVPADGMRLPKPVKFCNGDPKLCY
ncbi:unnamed protein product, partial [Hymenolepis diminuta]